MLYCPMLACPQRGSPAWLSWTSSETSRHGTTRRRAADQAAGQLLVSLRIDSEPVVRSNSAWSLGRLYGDLVEPRQREVEEALVQALLQDSDLTVRDEARLALEQLEDPEVLERLHTLVDEGLLS